MNIFFEKIINDISSFMINEGYKKRGKSDFYKKAKPYQREEYITFSSRQGKGEHKDFHYISAVTGISYKEVNKADQNIINDFLNSYPLIAGSISKFREENSGYLSIPINNLDQVEDVISIIKDNIINGAFNFFNSYPTLNSIAEAIEQKDSNFLEYYNNPTLRMKIRRASIYYILQNKEVAMKWFSANASDAEISKKMKDNW